MTDPPDEPVEICPVCSKPIKKGDPRYRLGTLVVHLKCNGKEFERRKR